MLGIPVGMVIGLVEEDLDGLALEIGVGAGLKVSLGTLFEGVIVLLVPPPHAQHASFAVVPKFSKPFPYCSQAVPVAYHSQL